MLNLELLNNLYNGLPDEQKKQLITLLFKRSKQTMAYFARTKDVSLSKLEIIADFFHMPLDYFRKGSTMASTNVAGNGNTVGNVNINSNLVMENDMLKGKIANLEAMVEAKNETINAKNEVIATRIEENETLKEEIRRLRGG